MLSKRSTNFMCPLWTRARLLISVVRLKPFDGSTLEGRSKERYRRVALTALAAAASQGIVIFTALVSIPLAVGYLGSERYGLWVTITSITAVLGFADLGLGNGLLNTVSEANGKDDREAARRYVSSALFLLSGVSLSLTTLFAIAYPWIPWWKVFNVSSAQAIDEAGPATAVFAGCFLANVLLSVTRQAQAGYQEGYITNICLGLGSLLGLGGVLLAIHLEAGLPWLVLSMAGAPVLAMLLNGVILFGFQRPWLRPRWSSTTGEAAKRILRLGAMFFVLQTAFALAFYSDNIVAAQILGPEAVTRYSVAMRMFSIVPAVLIMMLTPLWPAYGETIARGDVAWARIALVRSLVVASILAGLICAFLVAFGARIVELWVGPEIVPSFPLLLGLGVWTVMMTAGNTVGMFLNGANVIKFQAVTAVLMALGAIVAKIALANVIGLPGIIWGTVVAYTVFTAIPMAVYIPKLLSKMRVGH